MLSTIIPSIFWKYLQSPGGSKVIWLTMPNGSAMHSQGQSSCLESFKGPPPPQSRKQNKGDIVKDSGTSSLSSLHSSNLHHVVCLWPTDNLATKEVYGEVPFYAPARWLTGTNRPTSSGRKFAVSLPVTAVQRPELETHSWSPGDKSDKAILMY